MAAPEVISLLSSLSLSLLVPFSIDIKKYQVINQQWRKKRIH